MTFGLKRHLTPNPAEIHLPGDSTLTFTVSVPMGEVTTVSIRYSIDPAIGVIFSDARCPLPQTRVAFPNGRPGLDVTLTNVEASGEMRIPIRCRFSLRAGAAAPESFEVACVATDPGSRIESGCDIVVIP